MSRVGERAVNNPLPIVKGLVIGFIIIFIIGIGIAFLKPDNTIYFKKNLVLDYGTKSNTISLIDRIGGHTITSDDVDEKTNSIQFGTLQIQAKKVNTNEIGEYVITYVVNNEDEITKKIKVDDISKPEISIKNDKITIDEENINLFKIENFFSVSDNFSKTADIHIEYSENVYHLEPGKNTIVIMAIDEHENKAESKLIVNVKKKKKEPDKEKEKEKDEDSSLNAEKQETTQSNENLASQPSTPVIITPSPQPVVPSVPKSVPVTAPSRRFYTRDYDYDLAAMQSACINYGESMVNQGRANGYDYYPFVEGDNISGYEISFK